MSVPEHIRPVAQQGFTLVELMVALTLGLVVLAGVFQVFSVTLAGNVQAMKMGQLNQELRSTMDIMTRELRRSGRWDDAINFDPVTNPNPYVGLTVGSISGSGNDCILYAYDTNDALPVSSAEFLGFRRNGNYVEWSKGLSTGTTDCTASWGSSADIRLNSSEVQITNLAFTLPPAECTNLSTVPRSNCNPCDTGYVPWSAGDILVKIPRVDITLSGQRADDANMAITLTQTVRVRNPVIEKAASAGPPAGTGC